MSDPLAALRTDPVPTRPDPAFEARLRARLEDALTLPEGVDVTVTTLEALAPATTAAAATGPTAASARMALTPYLAVTDARRAIDWYVDVFDARLRGEPIVMPDGRVGHAELDFGGSLLMLADEFPDIGHAAPSPGTGTGTSVTLHLEVAGIDALVSRAVDEGAVLDRPPADHAYGRNAALTDPFGHRWLLSEEARPEQTAGRHGDMGHLSLLVPDLDRAQAFYGTVLGWTFAAAGRPDGRRVAGAAPPISVFGGGDRPTAVVAWQVDDIAAAVATVRVLGGAASDPAEMPYGLRSDCTDDQGMDFYLWQPPAGTPARTGEGDIAYLTLNVVDSARFRSFFGEMLGWTFTPGRIEDGWQVEGPTPMVGLAGGADRPSAAPMYRVDDVEAAVRRVRAAGGSATDVATMPYGLTSDCTDDQGTPFYLGQL